jgi:hypothetical protein
LALQGEVRSGVSTQRDEQNVLFARSSDLAAANDPAGVGKQDDLQQDSRMDRRCSDFIVLVHCFELTEIDLVVNEVIDCLLSFSG